MRNSIQWAAIAAGTLASGSALAGLVQYPNKPAFLAAIHADLAGAGGLATGVLTARPAVNVSANNRGLLIDSNVVSGTRLMSWSNGIGAPNPVNITMITTFGRPTTAFGCYLRVSNNLNQQIGGPVTLNTATESMHVTVPAGGAYVSFTTSTPFTLVLVNALNANVVEMIDDVLIGDSAGLSASNHAVDAGIAYIGANQFDSRYTTDDQAAFLDSFGGNYGNGRDVWWTYTPSSNGYLVANTYGCNFDTLLALHDGTIATPSTGSIPLVMNDQSGGNQSEIGCPVIAGRRYYIRVGGWQGATGVGPLNLNFIPDEVCQADFNGDGNIDFFDYLDFVDAYSIGC